MEIDTGLFEDALPYKGLTFKESYFDYGGPRFFSMQSGLGIFVFATCADEGDPGEDWYETWLLLAVSERRFQQIRSGGMSMLDAYRNAGPDTIWKVDLEEDKPASSRSVTFDEIPEVSLPSESSFLTLPTGTARELDLDSISREANDIERNMFVIELFPENETRTELPLRDLSSFTHQTQSIVDSLLAEKRGEKSDTKELPVAIKRDAQLKAKYILAASFALVVVESAQGVPEVSQLPEVMDDFGKLLSSTESTDGFLDELDRHSRRTKSRFITHAKSLSAARCGLAIHSIKPSGDRKCSKADLDSIRSAIEAFDGLEPSIDEIDIHDGALIALNTKSWSFVAEDRESVSNEYRGKVHGDIRSQLDGVKVGKSTHMNMKIEVEYLNQFDDGGADKKYSLIGLEQV